MAVVARNNWILTCKRLKTSASIVGDVENALKFTSPESSFSIPLIYYSSAVDANEQMDQVEEVELLVVFIIPWSISNHFGAKIYRSKREEITLSSVSHSRMKNNDDEALVFKCI